MSAAAPAAGLPARRSARCAAGPGTTQAAAAAGGQSGLPAAGPTAGTGEAPQPARRRHGLAGALRALLHQAGLQQGQSEGQPEKGCNWYAGAEVQPGRWRTGRYARNRKASGRPTHHTLLSTCLTALRHTPARRGCPLPAGWPPPPLLLPPPPRSHRCRRRAPAAWRAAVVLRRACKRFRGAGASGRGGAGKQECLDLLVPASMCRVAGQHAPHAHAARKLCMGAACGSCDRMAGRGRQTGSRLPRPRRHCLSLTPPLKCTSNPLPGPPPPGAAARTAHRPGRGGRGPPGRPAAAAARRSRRQAGAAPAAGAAARPPGPPPRSAQSWWGLGGGKG